MASPEQLPPPTASPEEIRRTAEEVLSRPEFAQPPETIFERIARVIQEAIADALNALFSGGRSGVVAWTIVAVVAIVVTIVAVRVIRSVRGNPVADDDDVRIVASTRRPATDWDREAAEHAAAGRWRDALRCRYRALVARLAALGAVDEIPGRTAGEYRLDLRRSRPDAAEPFGEATEMFERVWYGHRDTDASEEERFRELAAAVERESAR